MINFSRLLTYIVPIDQTSRGGWDGPSPDRALLRWLTTLAVLAMSANILAITGLYAYAALANAVAGMLMALYFGDLFFRRFGSTQQERLIVAGAALGIGLAYAVIPGIVSNVYFLSFIPWIAAAQFYAGARGWVQQRLLGRRGLPAFLGLWLANFYGLLAVPLFLLGIFLVALFRVSLASKYMGGSPLAVYIFAAGLLGLVIRLVLSYKTGVAARRILIPDPPGA